MVALVATLAATPIPASADATAPPSLPDRGAGCPGPQYPPAGYPPGAPPIPYEVPFVGTIDGGNLQLRSTGPTVPAVEVPHIYGSVCGLVNLPGLVASINPSNIYLSATNAYIAGIEALPIDVGFGQGLTGTLSPQSAPNGGLNVSVSGAASQSIQTLGMRCTLTLPNLTLTTQTSGGLTGQPVTGPTGAHGVPDGDFTKVQKPGGVAEVVSNDFPVPAVPVSSTCPASMAETFNTLLGLPAPPGRASFVAPFTFYFELTCTDKSLPCTEQRL
ncbi:hypothetical protein K6U06_09545 [Acidiferrimicrobium sp. IK]|uniref:hypothetical protein n=1 Tax=Acidiferrimicrobium sp. IK TaxID=2871700 RepID=UPI0021CB57A4|nr:hypothetical protein [Acidiferrimicrobium sp. IK]MCU4184601.1 hypothetical protein [Acidiferrimicrobium sp. IK]